MVERAANDFGLKMKRAREARGVSLREIANITKISISALEALERSDISRLPGGIFTRAFVRAYAVEIGLDPEQTVREFLTQFPHDSVTAGSPHVPQEDHAAIEGSRRSAETALKLAGISLPVAGLILYLTLAHRPPAAAVDPSPRASTQSSSAALDLAGEPMPVGSEPLTFEIVATAPVSIDVAVDGVRRETRAIGIGERMVLQADREMTLTMSDASAVQLTINSQPAVSLGSPGQQRTVQIGRRNYGTFLASQ